jgi:Zinc carboxypeptidase
MNKNRAVEAERLEQQLLKAKLAPREPRAAVYDRYMDYYEIDAFVKETAAANPDLVTLVSLAKTVQMGISLNALKISSGPGKTNVFFDCGFQGRDWIAPPVCMRIIEEVIANPELQELADWTILPMANPEGYLHTWDPAGVISIRKCIFDTSLFKAW